MSKKKSSKKQPQKSDNTIRYIAIAVILIVIAVVAWMYFPKSETKANVVATEPVVSTLEAAATATDAAISTPASMATATEAVVNTPENAANSTEAAVNTGGVCSAFDSIPAAGQYKAPPMMVDQTKQYFATFKMAKGGEFVIQLYADKAPITVNSFVFLACKEYFNGLTFHRVLEGFMAQGGDPTGTGSGGPGYEFVNENSDLTFDKAGVVAMANAGPDTNGSQFFITFAPADFLNGGYTIFGQVATGMDVVNAITRRDPQTAPAFDGDAMESVTISEK